MYPLGYMYPRLGTSALPPPPYRGCAHAKCVRKWLYKTRKIPTVKSCFTLSENKRLSASGKFLAKNIWNLGQNNLNAFVRHWASPSDIFSRLLQNLMSACLHFSPTAGFLFDDEAVAAFGISPCCFCVLRYNQPFLCYRVLGVPLRYGPWVWRKINFTKGIFMPYSSLTFFVSSQFNQRK